MKDTDSHMSLFNKFRIQATKREEEVNAISGCITKRDLDQLDVLIHTFNPSTETGADKCL